MSANYSPKKFLWASILFFLLLFILSFLILVYSQQRLAPTTRETISPLGTGNATPTQTPTLKEYSSKFNWKVSYPPESRLDTSIEPGSSSLERVTISLLDSQQPQEGFSGFSVDLSVEPKTTSLSTFADRDSLQNTNGARQYFSVTTLGKKTGYKVLIKGAEEYVNYYLPLKDDSKVLVVTTATSGPNTEGHEKTVSQILETLVLLD